MDILNIFNALVLSVLQVHLMHFYKNYISVAVEATVLKMEF